MEDHFGDRSCWRVRWVQTNCWGIYATVRAIGELDGLGFGAGAGCRPIVGASTLRLVRYTPKSNTRNRIPGTKCAEIAGIDGLGSGGAGAGSRPTAGASTLRCMLDSLARGEMGVRWSSVERGRNKTV
eukprot:1637417-Rhodomonas_salina.1